MIHISGKFIHKMEGLENKELLAVFFLYVIHPQRDMYSYIDNNDTSDLNHFLISRCRTNFN